MTEPLPAARSAADPDRNTHVTPPIDGALPAPGPRESRSTDPAAGVPRTGTAYSGPRGPYLGPGGFLLLDKPAGISSFQALRPVKRAFPKAKVGHAGTLDPAASGLLIAGVASGTRLLEYLEGMPKTYAFTAVFGFVSDTCDLEGQVEAFAGTRPAASLSAEEVERALASFRGRIRQVPPAYSAIKIGGERAYALARAGEAVELEAREVEISDLRLTSFRPGAGGTLEDAPRAELIMTCSKGTYVRSLVVDLGRALGAGAVTGTLRRLAIGPFSVDIASAPDSLSAASPLLPLETAVAALPKVIVPDADVARFLNGQSVRAILPAQTDGPAATVGASSAAAESAGPSPAGADLGLPAALAAAAHAASPSTEVRAHASDGRLLAIASLAPDGLCGPRKVLAKGGAA